VKQHLLGLWKQLEWPSIKVTESLPTGEGVLDAGGVSALEVDNLFDAVNYAESVIGQSVLFRSLVTPLSKRHDIENKQLALEELRDNAALKTAIQSIISIGVERENSFYRLLFADFLPMFGSSKNGKDIEGYGYAQYKRGVRFVTNFVTGIQECPSPESAYLNELFDHIKSFAASRTYALMTQSVYLTETSLQTRQERRKSWWLPAVVFYPSLFKPLILALLTGALCTLFYFIPGVIGQALFLSPFLLLYFPWVGNFDRDNFIIPLREEYKQSQELASALDALGQLDELLSFLKFADNFGHTTVLPSIVDSEQHRMILCEAMNPILGKENPQYIGNDLTLDHNKVLAITGPNSGGKTAFCKTISQIQLLAQIGCFVPARSATLSVADKIFYQAPEISKLNDGEGRFGAELKRTKEVFLACSARSLVILDELSEGTTFEEKMESSLTVLSGFYRKGNSTILITHNHQLVDELVKQHIGVARQVEFSGDLPTHKIIEGISRVSHADRVAKKIGFSKEDIDFYLTQ
jgi:hypothetical protein